jgi:hypothetical protein
MSVELFFPKLVLSDKLNLKFSLVLSNLAYHREWNQIGFAMVPVVFEVYPILYLTMIPLRIQ